MSSIHSIWVAYAAPSTPLYPPRQQPETERVRPSLPIASDNREQELTHRLDTYLTAQLARIRQQISPPGSGVLPESDYLGRNLDITV